MALNVPTVGDVAAKWQRRASTAGQEYALGITRAAQNWQGPTEAAQERWFQGTSDANTRGAFRAGVQRAGNEKWSRKARQVGQTRYGPGITAGVPEYSSAMGPVLQTIAGVDLPERGIRGSEGNFERSARVGRALHAARTRG